MKVRALQTGYDGFRRWRAGQVFDLPESKMKKDKAGKPILPTWVESVASPKPQAGRPRVQPQPEETVGVENTSDEVI